MQNDPFKLVVCFKYLFCIRKKPALAGSLQGKDVYDYVKCIPAAWRYEKEKEILLAVYNHYRDTFNTVLFYITSIHFNLC